MYDIVALGESLIDFTPAGINEMGMPLFSQNPGGAPANVLAMASKLGRSTAFVGKVGRDALAAFFRSTWRKPVLTAPPCDGMTGCPRPLPLSNWMSTATAPSPSIEIQGRM